MEMGAEREKQAEVVPRIVILETGKMKSRVQNGDWSRRHKLGAGLGEDIGLNLDL